MAYHQTTNVDCSEIRQGFETGGVPSGSSVAEHLEWCPNCAELFRNAAALGRRLAVVASESPKATAAQLSATESLLAGEHGARAFLRSRSTRVRWAVSLALPSLLLVRELFRGRVAFREFSAPKVLAGLLLVALLGVVARSALVPMPLARRAAGIRTVLALVAWFLPCVLWLAPEARASADEFSSGFSLSSLSCFAYGSALAAPSFTLLWAFDRGVQVPFRVGALAAGSVAIVANLILLLHCPSNDSAHLWAGHFSIGLVWFTAVALFGARRRYAD
ncbi:MAG: hypothetical protein ABIQ16_22710 [Polyangiaceae bacterium]